MFGPKKSVCNLNPILLTRLIFGYYSKLSSPKLRILSKIYVVIIVTSLITLFVTQTKKISWIPKFFTLAEYLIYVTHSFVTEEGHVLNVYKSINIIDTLPGAKKMFRKLETFLITVVYLLVVVRILIVIMFCYNLFDLCFVWEPFGVFCANIIMTALDFRHLNLILIFSLLFVRVRIFKKSFECGFDNCSMQRFAVRKFIMMYEALVDSLQYKNRGTEITVSFITYLY